MRPLIMGVSIINSNFQCLKGEQRSMRFYLLIFGVLVTLATANAQSGTELWKGYFSYNSIKDVAYGDNKVFVAAENAVYTYDIWSQELSTITTI